MKTLHSLLRGALLRRLALPVLLWSFAGPATGAALQPQIRVVPDGESRVKAEDCYGILVGPGVNEPEPFPGYRGFVGWVTPHQLKNGTWLVAFSAGYWHASAPTPLSYAPETLARYYKLGLPADIVAPTGGRAMLIRSTDQGKSWSKPETLIDTPMDDRHPALAELADGTLLCVFFTYQGKLWTTNPSRVPRVRTTRSTDGGRTWDKNFGTTPTPFVWDQIECPLVPLKDGSVLVPISGQSVNGKPEQSDQSAMLRTADGGKSWEVLGTIGSDHPIVEESVAELPDGRLVMMSRPEGDVSWSSDSGRTWTPPVSFGLRMFAPALTLLRDGTLVCLHGSYNPQHRGLRAIFSTDGGLTWVAPAKDHGFLVDTAYGYARAMELADGSLYITYQDTGGHTSKDASHMALRALRLRVRADRSGIDLLPAPNR